MDKVRSFKLSSRECNIPCPGHDGQYCGGKGAVSIFNIFNTTGEFSIKLKPSCTWHRPSQQIQNGFLVSQFIFLSRQKIKRNRVKIYLLDEFANFRFLTAHV